MRAAIFASFIALILLADDLLAQCKPPVGGELEIALFNAIQTHDSSRVAQLLHQGANPNAVDDFGRTLLMCASLSDRNTAIVKLLIGGGADVNARTRSGSTVLMNACYEVSNPNVISILIKSGADVNSKARDGGTALMDACLWGNIDAVKLLLAAGAKVDEGNTDGITAIDFAKESGSHSEEIARLLINAGANPLGALAPIAERISNEPKPRSFSDLQKRAQWSVSEIKRFHDSTYSHSTKWSDKDFMDSLRHLNEYLRLYLATYLPQFPASLSDATSKDIGIWVHTSQDGKLRSWDWNTWMGGSSPQIYQIIQYKTSSGVRIYDPNDISYKDDMHNHWYDTIYTIKQKSGSTVYLAVEYWRADGRNRGQTITAMRIEDTVLRNVNIFQTAKELLSEISYHAPDPTEYEDRRTISLSRDGKILSIPLIDNNERPTSKYLRYYFDGECFVYREVK